MTNLVEGIYHDWGRESV